MIYICVFLNIFLQRFGDDFQETGNLNGAEAYNFGKFEEKSYLFLFMMVIIFVFLKFVSIKKKYGKYYLLVH